ncbi:mannosyl-glycoprotein endo-beta-N-acetylglucosamidase [Chitiniphilus eburneus]|uniref:Mannosyl-glycoprotein endo-beta-N-acetylglucosamidase n=1 Tax=Chitiniphilus eburneus TaxID=2571148 RepID=A0A4U0Q3L9_9NEIS|nr:mannosyl-glycoprotein endo-beta-N-acetylglucosamidase [Chitiniphilus eburneus]TJZ75579.1 mannosyl-glycoprotein endo-beta-N-acetylglucosamidase [Chitiniphilus eburneus]
MADQSIIKEFLVALGFQVDEKSLKRFTGGIEDATKNVTKLVTVITGAALTVSAGVAAFASNLESLYFASQRVGASATNIKAMEYAARNLGVSSDEARGSLEGLARFMRNNPAGESYLQSLGVQTRDVNGKLRDTSDLMIDLGRQFAKMPQYLANQYGPILGISENMILALRNGEFARYMEDFRKKAATSGMDKAAADAHQYMVKLRALGAQFEQLGIKVEGALLAKAGPGMDRFAAWFEKNGDMIADRIAEVLALLLRLLEEGAPILLQLLDWFVKLDKATDGWSTKILLLVGAFMMLGGPKIISGLAGLAASLMGISTAAGSAATTGGALLGVLGRLGLIGAAGAAGYWVGSKINEVIDSKVKEATGGKETSLGGWLYSALHREELEELNKPIERKPKTSPAKSAPAAGAGAANATPPAWNDLANSAFGTLIAKGEGDYNSVNRGKSGGYRSGTEDLERMTLAQVMQAQKEGKFNAAGRYQVIGSTLAEAVKTMKLQGGEKFDRSLQDRIFSEYLVGHKRRAIADYLSGKSENLEAAIRAAAMEWASVADPHTGKSYYDGMANNRASISADQMAQALKNSRSVGNPMYPASTVAPRGNTAVQIAQETKIYVQGGNPAETGRQVAAAQTGVNEDMARNFQGVIM